MCPCGSRAFASEEPSFRRSRTSARTFLSSSFSTCSVSAETDSTSGMPAATSVASCRVIMATSPTDTRRKNAPRPIDRPFFLPPFSSVASVRSTPSRLSWARSTFGLSASRTPETCLPLAIWSPR